MDRRVDGDLKVLSFAAHLRIGLQETQANLDPVHALDVSYGGVWVDLEVELLVDGAGHKHLELELARQNFDS